VQLSKTKLVRWCFLLLVFLRFILGYHLSGWLLSYSNHWKKISSHMLVCGNLCWSIGVERISLISTACAQYLTILALNYCSTFSGAPWTAALVLVLCLPPFLSLQPMMSLVRYVIWRCRASRKIYQVCWIPKDRCLSSLTWPWSNYFFTQPTFPGSPDEALGPFSPNTHPISLCSRCYYLWVPECRALRRLGSTEQRWCSRSFPWLGALFHTTYPYLYTLPAL
jgi:hypothetical protein